MFAQDALTKITDILPHGTSNAGNLEKMKTIYSIQINKLEIEIRDFKQKLSKKS